MDHEQLMRALDSAWNQAVLQCVADVQQPVPGWYMAPEVRKQLAERLRSHLREVK